MRYPIWKKDDFFLVGDKRFDMNAEVVTIEEGKDLKLCWGYDFRLPPLGVVSDVCLDDGEIDGEVQWFDEMARDGWNDLRMIYLDLRLGGYYTGIVKTSDRVTACHLKSVAVVPLYTIPGYRG